MNEFNLQHFARCLLLLAIGLISGCAYTTEGTKLGPITPTPSSYKPKIEHTVGDFSFTLEGGKMITSNMAGKLVNKQIFEGWKEHKYVSDEKSVDSSAFSGKADYNLTLSGSQYGESSIGMQILSGLSLFLIPYSVTENYDIQYTLKEVKTGKIYSAGVQESNKIYMELFLLFALPFGQNGQEAMFERMGDHLYDQLYKQGAFQISADINK